MLGIQASLVIIRAAVNNINGENMDELFRQLAFINAILGGFAITFLSVLLTAESQKKIVEWIVVVLFSAVACFILSALGATFSAVVAAEAQTDSLPAEVWALHEPMSLLFLLGIILLFVSLGMTGWIRSKWLGRVTIVIAVVSLVAAFFMIRPFLFY